MQIASPKPDVTPIMDRLKAETAENHARAEGRPIEQALIQGAVSRELFAAYLGERLHVHRALEPGIAALAASEARLAGKLPATLFQEENLLKDLEFFGVDATRHTPLAPTARFVGALREWAGARSLALLGAYYVFEGSKNGARYIARSVGRALGLSPGNGLHYLDPHGEAQRGMWQEFRAGLNGVAFTPDEAEGIVAAARRTFDAVAEIDDALWSIKQG